MSGGGAGGDDSPTPPHPLLCAHGAMTSCPERTDTTEGVPMGTSVDHDDDADDAPAVVSDTGRFAIVPVWLIEAKPSPGAMMLYVVLAARADNATRQAWPSRRTLGKDCGCSTDTIDRRLAELQALGAVSWTHRRDEAGDLTSSVYHVHRVRPGCRTDAATGRGTDAATGGRTDAAENKTHLELDPVELERAHPVPVVADAFDTFWTLWPKQRRVGKPKARVAFGRAVQRSSVDAVLAGVRSHAGVWASWPDADAQFVPHPTTWLNRDGWDDPPPAGRGRPTSGRRAPMDRLQGMAAALDAIGDGDLLELEGP